LAPNADGVLEAEMLSFSKIATFLLVLFLFVLGTLSASAQSPSVMFNFPDDIMMQFMNGAVSRLYSVDDRINPFYLRGDFDGDGRADYAILVVAKSDKAKGFAIWLSSKRTFVVLGAGRPFTINDDHTTNLDFIDFWQVYRRQTVEPGVEAGPPPKLIGEAILCGKSESASGLIYWTGRGFRWYQQGD
jgi:hypothetical protein